MDKYLQILMGAAVLIGLVVILLLLILNNSRNSRKLNLRDASLTSEELEEHARENAREHAVSRKRNVLNWPVPRMNNNYEFILSLYKRLNEDVQRKKAVPPAAEWLLDNFYILEEQVKGLRRDLNKRSYLRLPVLRTGSLKGYARIFAIAVELVAHTDGRMDEKILSDYLKAYQSHNVLFDREIWAIPMMIRLALLERIRLIGQNMKNTQSFWHDADVVYQDWLVHQDDNPDQAVYKFKVNLASRDEINPAFIEHLIFRLRRSGRSYVDVLKAMDENLAKWGDSTENIAQHERNTQSIDTQSIGNCITSLQYFASLDWSVLFESVSFVDQILRQDPDGTYALMDIRTRNYYRQKTEELAAELGVSELQIARDAIKLAAQARLDDDPDTRSGHVGYYLIGKGRQGLLQKQARSGAKKPKDVRLSQRVPGILYLGSVFLITGCLLALGAVYSWLNAPQNAVLWALLAIVALLIPASEIAIKTVNWAVSKAQPSAVFPRMELKDGIPEDLGTIVVIPTLLPDVSRVTELLANLESHYLSNRDDHLYFALIGAYKDSHQATRQNDSNIIDAAMNGICALNQKYAAAGPDKFYFFHRESQFNERNNKWIGWERKRGALMEFNDLVLGSDNTSFSYRSCENPPFAKIKYIITLDSDTILPIGMARSMVGTMAHPLNQPVIDPVRGIVVAGYGLMQPRIDVAIEDSNQSQFARIFTGQEGVDPYVHAISDVYQDLFGEGIFIGKGIYDLHAFQNVLQHAIPDDAILSHDLLEGSYVRTGLVTDLKLVDSYPSKYNSHAARVHRWVRGDWQLLPLLFGKIASRSQGVIKNPLSSLSRWKICDNMRRSLLEPALLLLAVLSFTVLPGNLLIWLGFLLTAIGMPLLTTLLNTVVSGQIWKDSTKRHMPVINGLKASLIQTLLLLTFLPFQAWSMIQAIVVTLIRVLLTKKNLLEWVTSADADKSQKNTCRSYLVLMSASFWAAAVLLALVMILNPAAVLFVLPLIGLWAVAPFIAFWISRDIKKSKPIVTEADYHELGRIARKTWRYFEEFANAKNNNLAPDNYQADPPRGIAGRTSPTNIGLGLMASLSARDLGYISTSVLAEKIDETVSTLEILQKWNGHLYNWYDTRSLQPLHPGYVSTVDSGNLLGYLITLAQGLHGYLHSPLVDSRFAQGIRDTLLCSDENGRVVLEELDLTVAFTDIDRVDLSGWRKTLTDLAAHPRLAKIQSKVWKAKIEQQVDIFAKEMTELLPGAGLLAMQTLVPLEQANDPDVAARMAILRSLLATNAQVNELPGLYLAASSQAAQLLHDIENSIDGGAPALLDWLSRLSDALATALTAAKRLKENIEALITRVQRLAKDMRFLPLYDRKKQLFHIGFNLEDGKLSNSYYDLLASEARQTSYICIARGEIPLSHWFKMGRALTVVDRYKGLISWTGTMFEYLMPLLIMKTYKNTMLDETFSFVIKSQKKYGRQKNLPWGTSESGYSLLDVNLDYQYKAIGVPWLGLKRGLMEDSVVAPYATFLTLPLEPEAAIQNLKRLREQGLDGPYGFYEAVDYTPERLPVASRQVVVKSYMAHHQGMSLVSINNFLHDNIMQQRFHADPAMHAARLLLQEKVPARLVFTKDTKEKVVPYTVANTKDRSVVRRFSGLDPLLPRAHILSNGTYSVLITDRGTGYSKVNHVAVTRWRTDSTLEKSGMFIYLKNVASNAVWSTAFSPVHVQPDHYDVTFETDKATIVRLDGFIETKTEIVVASDDNTEIRRISLKNKGDQPCILELTSYFELVLTTQAADLAHPAFSNLFVETSFDAERKSLFATRRSRSDTDRNVWIAHTAIIEGETLGEMQYETDRLQMIGRGCHVGNPAAMQVGKSLSNTVGTVLDPVMSLRVRVKLAPDMGARISFVTAVGASHELLLAQIDKYMEPEAVESAFRLALTRSKLETAYLNLDAAELELFQNMIGHIIYFSPTRRSFADQISKNRLNQPSFWKYGISGDVPIVLLVLDKSDKVAILSEALKAHEYWRRMDLNVDLVILSVEEYNYSLPLFTLLSDIVSFSQNGASLNKPKDIFILDQSKMTAADVSLFYAAARIILLGDGRRMAEQLAFFQQDLPEQRVKQTGNTSPAPRVPAVYEPNLSCFNGLGGFSPDGHEYIIRLAKNQMTPMPWVNVIANQDFGFMVSEAGSGYTWFGNSRENKLTPWNNDAVSDSPGEVLYIADSDSGQLWTPTALPIREEEPYIIRHGFGYSVFEHESHGIAQSWSQHVAVTAAVKVSLLTLRNTTAQTRNLILTYYVRPVLGVSEQMTAYHIRSQLSAAGTLLIQNAYNDDFASHVAFIAASPGERSWTCDRQEFFGSGGMPRPDSLDRTSLSGTTGSGFDPCAAIQVKVTLKPAEACDVVFLLGMAETCASAEDMVQQYAAVEPAKASLLAAQAFWQKKINVVQVNTPSKSMNLLMNGWLQYQVLSCRLWARSGFYQSGGAYGFRDQLQDSLPAALLWPEIARSQIILHASRQFTEGDVQHWWHAPSGKGIRSRYSDDRLWLPYVVAEYVRISGDSQILAEQIPFLADKPLQNAEDERYGTPAVTQEQASLYAHCIRAVDISLSFGAHGLPLMGSGDWNDGMNTVGNEGRGESVWLAWFLAAVLERMVPICRAMDDAKNAEQYTRIRQQIFAAIADSAWDGAWYRRAYFDNGQPLGSIQNHDCMIDSIAQSWSVLSGHPDLDRSRTAMKSLEEHLIQRQDGLIKLLTPPFDHGDSEPGYIKGYGPGIRENGGQYTHAAVWAIMAVAGLGDGEQAAELFDLINPINHTRNDRENSRYKLEPYVMAADVYATHPHTGRGGWSWYTGSAGWMYQAGLNSILGFGKTGDTLVINPCIPGRWKAYSITYRHRSSSYHIRIINPDGVMTGVRSITIDGIHVADRQINLQDDNQTHELLVTMGEAPD